MSKVKLFFSGTTGGSDEMKQRLARAFTHRLCSCHDAYVKEAKIWAELCKIDGAAIQEMMLDSGAFTAWSKGKRVDLKHLISVYKNIMSLIPKHVQVWLINLDVIPGSPGVTAGPEEIAQAIKTSDENFKILKEEFGDIVLPVFHQNESEERMFEVAEMADYICVSPRNDLPEWTRVNWSNYVHRKLPGKKCHGLAATGGTMLKQVPWYSVDSATWLYTAVMGRVNFNDNGRLTAIATSDQSPDRHNAGMHICNMPPGTAQAIIDRAASYGLTLQQIVTDQNARRLMSGLEFVSWHNSLPEPNHMFQDSLFEL
tara:strand:+ start:3538 stop:4476 length:939 start_codon:yes stop_codon:yes gene_type:complete